MAPLYFMVSTPGIRQRGDPGDPTTGESDPATRDLHPCVMPRAVSCVVLVVLALLSAPPQAARGQSMLDLIEGIRQGGGWVQVPVQGGEGRYLSQVLPTLGLTLTGCMQVYAGHSGAWEIEATDPLGEGRLEVSVTGGEGVPFRYQTGARAQLRVDARWSEPRDTTLLVWVGLETPLHRRDACEPIYGDAREDASAVSLRTRPRFR